MVFVVTPGRKMNSDTQQESVTVELHVRSLAPRAGKGQQESAIDRLNELESEGHIDEFSVNVWGKRVSLSSAASQTDAAQFVLDRVEEFRDWARRTGRSVDSFFETRRVESSITDEKYAALVLPSLTLAEYRGGELAYVAPCSDGGDVHTVDDRLDTLESGPVMDSDPLGEGTHSGPMLAAEEAEE